jgi:long-chain acyl-CoA synthetase
MSANIARLLEASARRWPDKTVLSLHGEELDFGTLERRAGGVARALAASGVGPGDRIAIQISNRLSFVAALWGGLKTGAAVAPLNERLISAEQDKIVADLDPRLVVTETAPAEDDFAAVDVAPEDPAIILYTSGSTGAAKGVLLSQGATDFALESWKTPVMDLAEDDIVLSALPLAHSLGIFGSVMAPLLAGARVVFLPRFAVEDALDIIAREKITIFPGVAPLFRRIVDAPASKSADFSSLRYALSGAAPCPWELFQEWQALTGTRIIRGYGMTEMFRPISFAPTDDREIPESIGRAMPSIELRVVDDDGKPVAMGESGELLINSPAHFSGYLNRPDETAEVLTGDWFKTGDIATISEDGFVRIVGRKKEMILRGGYTVSAGEIEAVLATHPKIAEAAVIGVPDRDLGEDIAAFVTPRPGMELAPDEVVEFCKERMASYKYPRRVRVREELPRGPTGKVAKRELKL